MKPKTSSNRARPPAAAMLTLVTRTRTHRRFDEKHAIPRVTLRALINLARLSPSGGNMQSLKFIPSNTPQLNRKIFPCLRWAGYLKDWPGPAAGERPAAYIIILNDKTIRPDPGCDHGIAAQSIMLGATEAGLGGCMIGSINRPVLRKALRIPAQYEILLTLALGRPRETVILETARRSAIKYWRDARDRHHVPKRPLKELIIFAD